MANVLEGTEAWTIWGGGGGLALGVGEGWGGGSVGLG